SNYDHTALAHRFSSSEPESASGIVVPSDSNSASGLPPNAMRYHNGRSNNADAEDAVLLALGTGARSVATRITNSRSKVTPRPSGGRVSGQPRASIASKPSLPLDTAPSFSELESL